MQERVAFSLSARGKILGVTKALRCIESCIQLACASGTLRCPSGFAFQGAALMPPRIADPRCLLNQSSRKRIGDFPQSSRRPVEACAQAPQPKGRYDVDAGKQTSDAMDTQSDNPSPMVSCTAHRQTHKAGAWCGNSARRSLRGGCPVTGISTATYDKLTWRKQFE